MRRAIDRVSSKAAVVALKVSAATVTAGGAAIALFGDPRSNGTLTRWGYFALSLIIMGFVITATIEVLQARADKRDNTAAELREKIGILWEAATHERLVSIAISFMHRVELPASEFMAYLNGVVVEIVADREIAPDVQRRLLRIEHAADSEDIEKRYSLVILAGDVRITRSDGLSLYRAASRDELVEPASPAQRDEGVAPNTASDEGGRMRTAVITVESIVQVCGGGQWGYVSSNSDHWYDENSNACGVYASLPWTALELGSAYLAVSDLAHLRRLAVVLPHGFDLRPVDTFDATVFGSRGFVGAVDLTSARFAQRDDRRWEASYTGAELYAWLKAEFEAEQYRRLSGFYQERAG
jgi:hypothetical protein